VRRRGEARDKRQMVPEFLSYETLIQGEIPKGKGGKKGHPASKVGPRNGASNVVKRRKKRES